MDEGLEGLVEAVREAGDAPRKRIRWICPVCDGATLDRERILHSDMDGVDVQVSTGMGELVVEVDADEDGTRKSSFPIRYCPWCGRKIRAKYRKGKRQAE